MPTSEILNHSSQILADGSKFVGAWHLDNKQRTVVNAKLKEEEIKGRLNDNWECIAH